MNSDPSLCGRRVLIVEDDLMIAELAEDILSALGCVVVGPAFSLQAGLDLIDQDVSVDMALLDIRLADLSVFPVADALRAKGVPIVFATGFGETGLRPEDQGTPVLMKPYRRAELARVLSELSQ